jgi:hypothetical protein
MCFTFGTNNMKRPVPLILIAAASCAAGICGGYFWGHSRGHRTGLEEGCAQVQYQQNLTNSVYLTLAAKKIESGDPKEADRIRNLLLFGSALDIKNAIESAAVPEEVLERAPSEGVLREVAAYYWRHPETISILDDDPARRHLKPRLLSLFEQYKPAEQGSAGQPATRSQSKSEGSDKPQPEAEGRSR